MVLRAHPLLKSAFLALLALQLLPCAAARTADPTVAATPQQAPHPCFRDALYPAWSQMTPQQALTDLREAMVQNRQRLEAIAALSPEQYNFDNTFLAYTEAGENVQQVLCYINHLVNTAETPERLSLRNRVVQEHARFKQELDILPRIWQVLHAAAEAPWVTTLSESRKKIITMVLLDLKHTGAHLPPEQRARKAAIEQELQFLGFTFSRNLAAGSGQWSMLITDAAQLDGMDDKWMQAAADAARAAGHDTEAQPAWLLTTASAGAVLYHCKVQETRRHAWCALNGAGTAWGKDNEPVIYRIMELRHELATLLGYRHYADMKTANRMMRSGENAMRFVDELLRRSEPAWQASVANTLRRFSEATGQQLTAVAPWDEAYLLHHRVRAPQPAAATGAAPAFRYSDLTPYLETESVLKGMFNIWSNLLGVNYTELPTAFVKPGGRCPDGHVEIWAEGVRCFAVHDRQTQQHLGSFFLDLYPRRGKRSDLSYCFPLRVANPGEPQLATMEVNFPTPAPDRPSLLSHLEFQMLYHEFGHLMHMCLSRPELRPLAPTFMESDFIETPSHLQENWVWEPETLASFARHYKTGAPIPQELLQQLARARRNSSISHHMSMLCSAKLDLELHMHFHEKFKGRPLDEVSAEILKPWLFPGAETVPCPMRTLTHCISAGYDAGFYTYKWSEVMAADAFSRFKKEGILNPATGADYRRTLLTPGGTKPAGQLYLDFMGREPDPNALLRIFPIH